MFYSFYVPSYYPWQRLIHALRAFSRSEDAAWQPVAVDKSKEADAAYCGTRSRYQSPPPRYHAARRSIQQRQPPAGRPPASPRDFREFHGGGIFFILFPRFSLETFASFAGFFSYFFVFLK